MRLYSSQWWEIKARVSSRIRTRIKSDLFYFGKSKITYSDVKFYILSAKNNYIPPGGPVGGKLVKSSNAIVKEKSETTKTILKILSNQDLSALASMQIVDVIKNLSIPIYTIQKDINSIDDVLFMPKIKEMIDEFGEADVQKFLVLIAIDFCNAIQVKNNMLPTHFLEVADFIIHHHSYESVYDVLLALKIAKQKGRNFYNLISFPVFADIFNEYFQNKISYLEHGHESLKGSNGSFVTLEQNNIILANKRRLEQDKYQLILQQREANFAKYQEKRIEAEKIKSENLDKQLKLKE